MKRILIRSLFLTLCMVLAMPVVGLAQPLPPVRLQSSQAVQPAQAPLTGAALAGSPSVVDQSYPIGVGDEVAVGILGRSDFNARSRVGADGALLLPYLGAVQAAGQSPDKFAQQIRAALIKGGFFADPMVHAEVVGVASRYVTVLGAVGTPGLLPLDREYRLSEVVARVGGRNPSGADYVVLTRPNGQSQRYKMSDLATGAGDQDPVVAPGDKLFVPTLETEVFYLTGAVKSPGAYPLVPNMTLRTALARGGGVSDMGSDKKAKINRKGSLLKGVKLDTTIVESGDIITVGERLF